MDNILGRRALFKLAGAGLLGVAAGKVLEHLSPPVVNAHDVLTVKGGKLHDVHQSLATGSFSRRPSSVQLINSRCTTL